MNSVNMIGRLTNDPELRRTQTGTACCGFSLAVKRPKVKDTTDFHNFVVWQQGAEYLSQYGHKGDLVGVTGYLTTREWTDKDGNKHKVTEVTCDSVELLSSKRSAEAGNNTTQRQNYQQGAYGDSLGNNYQQRYPQIDVPDEQLPF